MILVIDNYDSFTYNLVQMIGEILLEDIYNKSNPSRVQREEIQVVRNDEITVEEIEKQNPSHIILSPGPGRPSEAGICESLIQRTKGKYIMLGICLGHQAICEAFGAKIIYANKIIHGKQSRVSVAKTSELFVGLKEIQVVGRYHSLIADATTLPDTLEVIAIDEVKEIMAVKHRMYDIYGLQFHPESILTPNGRMILRNFLQLRRDNCETIMFLEL